MKKIMFNDKFLLTKAVLDGRKTQTRRLLTLTLHKKADKDNGLIEVSPFKVFFEDGKWKFVYDDYVFLLPKKNYPKYNVGEVVAVSQSYKKCLAENSYNRAYFLNGSAGWNNKMFVAADKMIHQIRITNVRVERLQDISDEDCLKEGITDMGAGGSLRYSFTENVKQTTGDIIAFSNNFATAKEAFAHLINKVSKKDVWEENPYVFVYDFELVK